MRIIPIRQHSAQNSSLQVVTRLKALIIKLLGKWRKLCTPTNYPPYLSNYSHQSTHHITHSSVNSLRDTLPGSLFHTHHLPAHTHTSQLQANEANEELNQPTDSIEWDKWIRSSSSTTSTTANSRPCNNWDPNPIICSRIRFPSVVLTTLDFSSIVTVMLVVWCYMFISRIPLSLSLPSNQKKPNPQYIIPCMTIALLHAASPHVPFCCRIHLIGPCEMQQFAHSGCNWMWTKDHHKSI